MTQWNQFLKKTAKNLGFYNHDENKCLIYLNDADYIGNADEFSQWALYNYSHLDKNGLSIYSKIAEDIYRETINNSKTRKYAVMTLNYSGNSEQIVFELFSDICPKTVDNFLGLCTGFKRKTDQEIIGYEGTEIHRIVPGMYIQGGRIKTGETMNSIFGGEFADESFHIKHTEVGLLGMCKRSGLKHTNECQFYITTGSPLTFLDNQNVLFGRVISGMHVIESIQNLELVNEKSANGAVTVTNCGAFVL